MRRCGSRASRDDSSSSTTARAAACFSNAPVQALGNANRSEWYLVREGADPSCVARGKPGAAHYYLPPGPGGTRLSS